ncbi:ribose transport system substrate-binding protein [Kribbella sp. VKM Ac-2527]|uniref:Ribose transport system substrate-binding protein n=1 Tax=Kribbella caucasensis TaxID=2512215 RepID=A0A4R6KHM4_9ACTN|nr:substrate-binding domain-containing protein [Kribbella sp. VKM Ac-2527]TDO50523.1 ribose transport system substrate-binding protein [Kribbella sp. VKM Ac-2527]
MASRRLRPSVTIIMALGALTLGYVSACGSNAEGSSAGSAEHKIALITAARNNPFFSPMECGAKKALGELGGGKLEVSAPSTPGDVPGMVQIINAAMAKKPDAIVIDPIDTAAFSPALRAAKDKGIKVVLVDNTLTDAKSYDTAIGANNEVGGEQAGQEMVKALGGQGKVLTLNGFPGQETLTAREEGFKKAVSGSPGIDYLGVQYSKQDATTAASVTAAALAKTPDLKGIWATSYNDMIGAVNALKRANKLSQVTVIAWDTTEDQVKMVRDGEIHALVGQSPELMGYNGVQSAYKLFDGTTVPQSQPLDTLLITKSNVDDPKTAQYFYTTKCDS